MPALVTEERLAAAGRFRRLLAVHAEAEDLIRIGAYKAGTSAEVDEAIAAMPAMREFLCQDRAVASDVGETWQRLQKATEIA